jgi:hypothetical protein
MEVWLYVISFILPVSITKTTSKFGKHGIFEKILPGMVILVSAMLVAMTIFPKLELTKLDFFWVEKKTF